MILVLGERSITEGVALDLADALGRSAEFWIGLQADVNFNENNQNKSHQASSLGIQKI